ncbi:hypothetical protein CPC16_007172, partial [Podila verticillata]
MSDRFIQLPELVEQLTQYLNHPALFKCAHVSKAWHAAFIPHLWHTIHDRSEPWIRIITDLKAERPKYNRDVAWYKQAIANNDGMDSELERNLYNMANAEQKDKWTVMTNEEKEAVVACNQPAKPEDQANSNIETSTDSPSPTLPPVLSFNPLPAQ